VRSTPENKIEGWKWEGHQNGASMTVVGVDSALLPLRMRSQPLVTRTAVGTFKNILEEETSETGEYARQRRERRL
jgi:hypothetical protein